MTTKTMTATAGPKIKTALPGPNAERVLAADQRLISPSYTRSYPMVAKSGRGIVVTDVDGNEFYDFSAGIAVTSTGHCHPDAGRRTHPHVGDRFLLREHGPARRSPVEDRAHARPAQDLLRQLRSRSHRVRTETGSLPYEEAEHHRLLWGISRTDHGCSLTHRFQTAAAPPLLSADAGRNSCAIS